jgi:hypothetical protein
MAMIKTFIENLDYKKHNKKQPVPNRSDLIQCVRLYFEVDKKNQQKAIRVLYKRGL